MGDPGGWSAPPPPPAPTRTPAWHVALVLALVAVALAVVVGAVVVMVGWLSAGPVDVTTEPTSAATAPATTEPTDPPDRDPAEAPALDVDTIAEQVAAIRGLPLDRPLRSRVLDGPALADKVSEIGFEDLDAGELRRIERLLVALRLADEDVDLAAVVEDLYREQVLGLYVADVRTLYVTGDGTGTPLERMTTAHEVTHALQDRAFNLRRLQRRYEDDEDASSAVLALIEGDAVLTQGLWAQEHLTASERLQAFSGGTQGSAALDRAPEYIRAGLFFPYQEGAAFVGELYRQGGFPAIDEAFARPPVTTAQIIEPDRYLAGEEATDVRVVGQPGGQWRRAGRYTFGQFDVRELLKEQVGADTAESAASGWRGGEVRAWARGDDTAVGLALEFESDDDGAEACAAVTQWYQEAAAGSEQGDGTFRGDRDTMALSCRPPHVRMGLAPDAATARRLTAGP